MISQLEYLKQSIQHLKDNCIEVSKIDAYNDVLQYIRTIQSTEYLHYNVAYSTGYADKLMNKEMNLDYFKTKYQNDIQVSE